MTLVWQGEPWDLVPAEYRGRMPRADFENVFMDMHDRIDDLDDDPISSYVVLVALSLGLIADKDFEAIGEHVIGLLREEAPH